MNRIQMLPDAKMRESLSWGEFGFGALLAAVGICTGLGATQIGTSLINAFIDVVSWTTTFR